MGRRKIRSSSALQRVAAAACAAILILAGCDRSDIHIAPVYSMPASAQTPSGHETGRTAANGCSISLAEIADERSDPENMGNLAGRRIRVADAKAWVRAGLASLEQTHGIRIGPGAVQTPALRLEVSLVKAYIESVTTSKSATVVLRVRFNRAASAAETKVYRGVDTGGNWASGDGEAKSALDAALAQALDTLGGDIGERCTPAATAAPAP